MDELKKEFKIIMVVGAMCTIFLIGHMLGQRSSCVEDVPQEHMEEMRAEANRDIVSVLPMAEILDDRPVIAAQEPKATAKPKIKLIRIRKPKTVKNTKKKRIKRVQKKKNIRSFKVTAYCPCVKCSGSYGRNTATGVKAKEGRTVAVDPSVIPYGTKLKINGNEYIAEDCGGAVKGNKIDLFMESHSDCLDWGVKTLDVEILDNK